MSVLIENQVISPVEYLAREAAKSREEGKSEYFDGQIHDMAIASEPHETIAGNLFGHFWSLLRHQGFKPYKSDLRTKLSETKYALTDVMLVKGKPVFSEDEFYNLLNPHLIVEVLSDGTASKDQGIKFRAYRQVESLQEYIMVSQHEYAVECYFRDEAGKWVVGDYYSSPDDVLKFRSIPIELSLRDIYEGVEL